MAQPAQSTREKTRSFTNDGKVSSEIVNDSYGTVDSADATGLDDEAGEQQATEQTGNQERPGKKS